MTLRLAGNHDIEQIHRESRIGKVSGDTRSHGSGAQNSHTT
jgi:hypothetical protein